MAKIAKPKKEKKASLHSRAARRASSPSLNTDKSLLKITPPTSNPHVHIFSGAHNAGIKKKKAKPLKRNQKIRQQKGIERADIVKEQLDSKLKKSLGRLKNVKERAKPWEALNPKLEVGGVERRTANVRFDALALDDEMVEGEGEEEWEDVDGMEEEGRVVPKPGEVLSLPVHPSAAEIPLPAEEEDEIL